VLLLCFKSETPQHKYNSTTSTGQSLKKHTNDYY